MNNMAAHKNLSERYTAKAYTHNYIFTFEFMGNVWALTLENVNADQLQTLTKLDRASRGAGLSLRFKPSNRDKAALLSMGAVILCSVEYFNDVKAACKYNRGEVAEMLVTEMMFGQTWKKDSVPFTDAGDVEANGKAYQHKHQGATFCNERTLHNLGA